MLNRVASYIGKAASSSNDLPSLTARVCASLTKLTATLEQDGEASPSASGSEPHNSNLIDESKSCAACVRDLRATLQTPNDREARMDGKLGRAVEKCRKACIKSLSNLPATAGSRTRTHVREVCEALTGLLDVYVDADSTVALLDTLFQLATAGLDPANVDACDRAYAYLVDAERRIQQIAASSTEPADAKSHANYTRCLAGAFANVAGMLYKAERHSFAIRFLFKACPLSTRATELYREYIQHDGSSTSSPPGSSKGKAKAENDEDGEDHSGRDAQAWKTHRMQTFRRWELLGVCYSKTNDRRVRRRRISLGRSKNYIRTLMHTFLIV